MPEKIKMGNDDGSLFFVVRKVHSVGSCERICINSVIYSYYFSTGFVIPFSRRRQTDYTVRR